MPILDRINAMSTRLAHLARWAACAAALAVAPWPTHADGKRPLAMAPLPAYQQECAGCHVAYPPGLLPAASWRRLMDHLPQHFGTDASLDAPTVHQLATWLAANAATGRRAGEVPPQDRITRTAWFLREHHEVPATTWQRPAVKSAANCAACHTRAEQGDFDEDHVRIPR